MGWANIGLFFLARRKEGVKMTEKYAYLILEWTHIAAGIKNITNSLDLRLVNVMT